MDRPNIRSPKRLTTIPAALTLGALSLIPFAAPGSGEVRVVPLDPIEALDVREAALTPAPRPLAEPGTTLLLPYFEIDSSGFTETTLIGIRNVSQNASASVDITYFDQEGDLVALEVDVALPPRGVYTRNLRDVAGIPAGPDGFKRGFAFVASSRLVSGDFFQINPPEDFATGGRLVADGERCTAWDVRFLQGGGFSGGTEFQLFVDNPLGQNPGDPSTATLVVADEAGNIVGTVGIQTDRVISHFPMSAVIAALPGGIGPSFGSVYVYTANAAGPGLLQVTYSAEGRYSIGVPASCQSPAP